MNFKRYLPFLLCLFLLTLPYCTSNEIQKKEIHYEKSKQEILNPDQKGGLYLPSLTPGNSFLKILIIFIQFPDDEWNPGFSQWPKLKPPVFMGSKFIDSTLNENSNNGNLTEYYRQMSLGKFNVIGKTYSMITPHSRDWYLKENKNREFINEEVLLKLDTLINFKQFDNWTTEGSYKYKHAPDNVVDMIWMVYRNISNDMSNPGLTAYKLGFGASYGKNAYAKWSGEASLGYGRNFFVDDSTMQINPNFSEGSGITVMQGYDGFDKIKSLCIHEFGHHLLGGISMHNGLGFWGMMSGYGSRCSCTNSFERNILGWTKFYEFDSDTIAEISLRDYVTTGDCVRIRIPNTSPQEYYLLENHQCISPFDINKVNWNSKGIYLLHQSGTLGSDLKFVSAAGKWHWEYLHDIQNPWGSGTIPVFIKSYPDWLNGFFETGYLPYKDSSGKNQKSLIYAYLSDKTIKDTINSLFNGNGYDSFKKSYNEVFDKWSNPCAVDGNNKGVNIGFQILSEEDGIVKVKIVTGEKNLKVLPPSKPTDLTVKIDNNWRPLLKWNANREPDINEYKIFRSYKSNNYNYLGVVHQSDIKYTHKDSSFAASNGTFYIEWKDESRLAGTNGNITNLNFNYKISAVDKFGKESVLSGRAIRLHN
jgi:M6 family metalloprotease-like protein